MVLKSQNQQPRLPREGQVVACASPGCFAAWNLMSGLIAAAAASLYLKSSSQSLRLVQEACGNEASSLFCFPFGLILLV